MADKTTCQARGRGEGPRLLTRMIFWTRCSAPSFHQPGTRTLRFGTFVQWTSCNISIHELSMCFACRNSVCEPCLDLPLTVAPNRRNPTGSRIFRANVTGVNAEVCLVPTVSQLGVLSLRGGHIHRHEPLSCNRLTSACHDTRIPCCLLVHVNKQGDGVRLRSRVACWFLQRLRGLLANVRSKLILWFAC